jgi:dCTP deaminase
MFIEITPMTFDVRVKSGTEISQLRFFIGKIEDSEIKSEHLYGIVLNTDEKEKNEYLRLDLSEEKKGKDSGVAFRAKNEAPLKAIDLGKRNEYDPRQYWDLLKADSKKRLQIRKEQFYILRSKERITVPCGIAVYCRAIDESIGEMRIHYAGFVHPNFGYSRTDGPGTPLIFEVRGHNIDVCLKDGERMARLIFYRMSEDYKKDDKPFDNNVSYDNQILELSKIFKQWN